MTVKSEIGAEIGTKETSRSWRRGSHLSLNKSPSDRPKSKAPPLKENGLFIAAEVFGIPVYALLDKGSTLPVLSPQVFEKIPQENKPQITPVESTLRMANGDTSTPQRKACFKVVIENTEFWPYLTIADIEVPMIIGYDFMYVHHCSLNVRDSRLKLGRKYFQCRQEGQNS